ncbi:VOC family protein [Paenibacillus thermotolerans]|uniref:VOC family protein n=1 Tax=Paenibacillus thermotolerans TaxID=3027807 RepID=UPI002368A04D|nr:MULTISPECIES: VOC family protein [unclassified Paenibacillus]
MGKVKPYIISEDARSQAEFYMQSLGGEMMSVITHGQAMGVNNEFKDKVMHMCIFVAGENPIFMADAIEPIHQGTGIALAVEYPTVEEAGSAFAKLAAGGKIKHPFEWQPFGLYYGELTDKYGIMWMVTAEQKS